MDIIGMSSIIPPFLKKFYLAIAALVIGLIIGGWSGIYIMFYIYDENHDLLIDWVFLAIGIAFLVWSIRQFIILGRQSDPDDPNAI